jgi:cyanophycinase
VVLVITFFTSANQYEVIMCPAQTAMGGERGFVIPIGGAEDKENGSTILKRFVSLCGGKEAKIAIIPTASKLSKIGPDYETIFNRLGVSESFTISCSNRTELQLEKPIKSLDSATGIFITGGNQLRISTIIGGTHLAQKIRRLNAAGVHVAGTSAGAAIMPEHMIAGGSSGSLPTEKGVIFAPGLGLISKIILDQHFSQRNRLGRLLSAVAYNPFPTALGICEDTAAFIGPQGMLEVVGSGSITIIDPSDLQYSSMADAGDGDTLSLFGLKLHILNHGERYNINTREVFMANS